VEIAISTAGRGHRFEGPDKASPVRETSRWSWQLGRLFGVAIRVHATFVVLLVWIAFGSILAGRGTRVAVSDLLLTLSVFGIVVLHELGHAMMARVFGIGTRSITLLPIGGIASLERLPEKPGQELLVALAGPAVNLVLAAAAFAALRVTGSPMGFDGLMSEGNFVAKLLYINLSLAGFNLLPAFPMDGGRALRAALGFRLGRVRATEIAAHVGQGMAVLFGIVGLIANPMLVIIAVFVWLGAGAEASMVRVKSLLESVPVRAATVTELHPVGPGDALALVSRLALETAQHDFPVVANGELVGVLTRADLLRGLTESGPSGFVGASMHGSYALVDASAPLSGVLESLEEGGLPTVVLDGPRVLGLLTSENLGDLLLQNGALFERRRRVGAAPPALSGPRMPPAWHSP
jgi:Zn-dependent protease